MIPPPEMVGAAELSLLRELFNLLEFELSLSKALLHGSCNIHCSSISLIPSPFPLSLAQAGEALPLARSADKEDVYDVILTEAGITGSYTQLQVIKVLRELKSIGLNDAKDIVDTIPRAVLEKVTKDAAHKAKAVFDQIAGAAVDITMAAR